MAQTPDIILKEIKGKKYKPLYFLHGDEPYYIDSIADELEKRVVSEAEKGFNQFVLYGKDTDVAGVLSYARRFPFMPSGSLSWSKTRTNWAVSNKRSNRPGWKSMHCIH
jgi:DNA polymerase-3 subunit delta